MMGLYGNGMHDFVLRELEIGRRAASCEDSERGGWSALDDLSYDQYVERVVAEQARERRGREHPDLHR